MSQQQWEPLTTAEAVIEAIKAGRHVEFTAAGCDYNLPSRKNGFGCSGGWIAPKHLGKDCAVEDAVGYNLSINWFRYRALIAPAPSRNLQPMPRP